MTVENSVGCCKINNHEVKGKCGHYFAKSAQRKPRYMKIEILARVTDDCKKLFHTST